MKIRIISMLCMALLMLQAGTITAQGIVGESDLFTFDTRPANVPLSNLALLLAVFLALAFLFVRYRVQRKRAQA